MSVSYSDLISAAKKSYSNAACEADWRGVCSRAYYAIYEEGKSFHKNLPSPGCLTSESAGGLHADLIDQLIHPTVPKTGSMYLTSKSVGYAMKTLHAARVTSDYKLGASVTATDAANSVAYADQVVNKLHGISSAVAMPTAPTPAKNIFVPPNQNSVIATAPPKGGRPTITRIK